MIEPVDPASGSCRCRSCLHFSRETQRSLLTMFLAIATCGQILISTGLAGYGESSLHAADALFSVIHSHVVSRGERAF